MKKVRAQVIAKQQRVWTEEEQRSIVSISHDFTSAWVDSRLLTRRLQRSIKEEIVEAMLGRGGFDGASGRVSRERERESAFLRRD